MSKKNILVIIFFALWAFGLTCYFLLGENERINIVKFTDQDILSAFSAKPDKSINFNHAIEHFKKYPERWNTVFKFLIESNLKKIALGRIDLKEDVYAFVSEYETKNFEDINYESHHKYIDFQYIIEGEEQIGLTNEKNLRIVSPYNEEKDIEYYNYDGGKLITASTDRYFVFFPEDRHKPCLKINEQSIVRKIVFKIKYK